jgi:hypothetical protein
MFMDVRMCECIVCMKGKSIKYKRVQATKPLKKKCCSLLVSRFNLLQTFNYTPYLFTKTLQLRDKFFLYEPSTSL